MKTDRIFTSSPCSIVLLFVLTFLVAGVPQASAQLVNGRLTTSVYTFEKFDTVDVSKSYIRAFQSAYLDVAQNNFSLHTHLQVAGTVMKTLDEEPDFRAYYLYARMKEIAKIFDLSLGRVPYYAGVGNGTLDGGLVRANLAESAIRLTLYGGARVPEDLTLSGWKSVDRNFVVGGQVLVTSLENARIGLSYVNKQRERLPYWTERPDSVFNPVSVYIIPNSLKEQYFSVDADYTLSQTRFYGRYDFDANNSETSRGQLRISHSLNEAVILTGDFIHRGPRVAYNSFFSVFATSSTDEFEAGVDYRFDPVWRIFGRGALVQYDDENSARFTVGVAQTFFGLTYRGGTGYAGELSSVSVYGAYPLLNRTLTPNASFSFGTYRLSEEAPEDDALALAVGATYRPLPALSIDLQVQDVSNRVLDSDVRFFGKINFWFAERMSILD